MCFTVINSTTRLVKKQIKKSYRNFLPVCDLDVTVYFLTESTKKYIDIYEMYFLSESTSMKFNYLPSIESLFNI